MPSLKLIVLFLLTMYLATTDFALSAPVQATGKQIAPSVPREPEGATGGTSRNGQMQKDSRLQQQKGALDRFKEFEGERTPAALTALLSAPGGVAQDPPVAISDGETVIRITVTSQSVPTLALKGAHVNAMRPAEKGKWVIEARPIKGAYQGSLTILNGDAMIEHPLTFAPYADIDLDRSGSISEVDFQLYLKKEEPPPPADNTAAEGAGAPGDDAVEKVNVNRDLNVDGREDYLDDYIFTVNYLAATRNKR